MLLYDKKLMDIGKDIIRPFDVGKVVNIGYDLSTEKYTVGNNSELSSIKLMPYQSAFVMSKETIELPNDIIAKVVLRNSRIRQGLSLDAPIYQPGHKTKVFFRITNNSDKVIELDDRACFATILFEELDGEVDKPYTGTFQNEFNYTGMGDYSSVFNRELEDIEDKIKDVKEVEKHIYGNVLAIMAIFVGVFSLINLNVSVTNQNFDAKYLIILNAVSIGAVSALMAIVDAIINETKKKKIFLWILPVICFIVAIGVQLLV